ncbi:MAG: hypothetical protein Q8O75_03375 [bacterium]|nr:hypothetical protein [bacterium]
MRNTVIEFFAHQLNTDPDIFNETIEALEHITGKKKVLEHFYTENQEKVRKTLGHLKLTYPTAEETYKTIGKEVKKLDEQIFELLDRPHCTTNEGCVNLISSVLVLHRDKSGFFLKRKVAERLLRENPPKNIMAELGYSSVEKLIEEEDLFEIYAALRFIEERDWLNSTYIAEYRKLTKEDFEVRAMEIRVLEMTKWRKVTEAFVGKKLHPMSHLKELGLIFVVPSEELKEASTTYLFAMTSHYIDEVNLYSSYFKHHSQESNFGEKVVSAIRGDVPEAKIAKGDANKWLIVQRYLFKENPGDIRLGSAHINPEALYHRGASHTLLKMGKFVPALDFQIWEHTNYVAVWFPTVSGKQELVNFNFMDNVMSVMNDRKFSERYSYHFHEALWNKIFINYFGVEKLEDVVIRHLLQGWFDIRKI